MLAKRPFGRFFAVFLGLFLLLSWIAQTQPIRHDFSSWLAGRLAFVTQSLYAYIDGNVTSAGHAVVHLSNGHFLAITHDCTAIQVSIAFAAALFALPAPFWFRVAATVIGLCLIQVFNILRFMHLFHLLGGNREMFDLAHVYFWQPVNMLIVLLSFAAVFRLSRRRFLGNR